MTKIQEKLAESLAVIEKASVEEDVEGFVRFIGSLMRGEVFFSCAKSDEWEKNCIFALLNVAL